MQTAITRLLGVSGIVYYDYDKQETDQKSCKCVRAKYS